MWWDSSVGLGMPVSIADGAPPFHPLSLLSNEWAIAIAAALLAGVCAHLLTRRLAVGLAVAAVLIALPTLSLLALGALSILVAIDWFAEDPVRKRWIVLVATIILAILGTRAAGFTALAAVTIAAGISAAKNRVVAGAGVIAAALIAALLSMPWILPAHSIRAEELPVEMQYATTWPMVMFAALVLVVARRASRHSVAVLATLLVLVPSMFSARASSCFVGEGRTVDRSVTSTDCLSRRGAMLFARVDSADSPALDWAGIRVVDGAPNRDPLPDFYLAPRFYVSRGTPLQAEPIERDRVLIDHLPAKIAAMGGPAGETIAGGGSVVVERRGNGEASLRIESNGWNVLVTNEAAWSGWRAYWNGERLPPIIVNHAFVGSFVPPGRGTLSLRYRPDAVDIGSRIAAGGLLLLVITLMRPWYRAVRLPNVRWSFVSLPSLPMPRIDLQPWHLLVPLLGYLVVLLANFAAIAGGADSSGYLNHSRLWDRGRLIVPISLPQQLGLPPEMDPAFIPLGFVHGPRPYTMVPSYPPGLPLLISAGRAIGGEWLAFRMVALVSAAGIFLLYLLARAYGLPKWWSLAGAAMLAVFPTYVFMAVQPMSDSVATAFAVAAMLGAVRSRDSLWWGVFAGAMMGAGVMIRPTQVLLFPALLLALHLRPRALLAFGLGGIPFAIAQMAISHHLYANALSTGYGGIGYLLALDNFPIRLKHYAYWLPVLATPIVFPGGLAIAFARTVAGLWTRAALAVWFLAFFLFYCFYAPYETWWYTRFLLPALPALILGALLLLRWMWENWTGAIRWVAPALALAVIVVGLIHCDRFDLLTFDEGERIHTEAVFGSEAHVPDDAVLVTMQFSGAVRYYAGREIVRWDGLNPDSFAQVRAASAPRPWFALLAQFEIADAMSNMPGRWVEVARFRDVILFQLRE